MEETHRSLQTALVGILSLAARERKREFVSGAAIPPIAKWSQVLLSTQESLVELGATEGGYSLQRNSLAPDHPQRLGFPPTSKKRGGIWGMTTDATARRRRRLLPQTTQHPFFGSLPRFHS